MSAPATSADFDRAYSAPFTFWGDVRIPPQLRALARTGAPKSVLELGCGVGRFSRYMASCGLHAVGVDFSAVAVRKAQARVAADVLKPEFMVGDVTRLSSVRGPFDISFDVGCFHCLDGAGQRAYVSEVARLLAPASVHLIWALDHAPSDATLSPERVARMFAPAFELRASEPSRRRLAASRWYWLMRS